jgi:hypothetical protein
MTYCIAVNNSSVCWIICINAYSSCLMVTSNSLWLNKITFNHKMSLAISWKQLWDRIISLLTMLDRLAIAILFTLVTVSDFLTYVIWFDREWTQPEVMDCSPLSVSCNKFMSWIVAVPNADFKIVPSKFSKPHLRVSLGRTCWKLWSLNSNVFSNVSICVNSEIGVNFCFWLPIKNKSGLIAESAS